jgi:hypothetical protein
MLYMRSKKSPMRRIRMRWNLVRACLWIFIFSPYVLASPAESRQLSLAESTDLIARWLISWGDSISNDLKTRVSPQILFGIAGSSIYGGCIDQAGIAIIPGSFFCPKTNTIVLEVSQLEGLRRQFGDGAVVYAVAHEFGHWLQTVVNAKRAMPAYELQADCIAGVILRNAATKISLTSDDLNEMTSAANAIGGGTHGTGQQRKNSLEIGYASGNLNTCFSANNQIASATRQSLGRTNILPAPPPRGSIPATDRQDKLPPKDVPVSSDIIWIRPYPGNLSEKTFIGATVATSIAEVRSQHNKELLAVSDVQPSGSGYTFTFQLPYRNTFDKRYEKLTYSGFIACNKSPVGQMLNALNSDEEFNRLALTAVFYSLCPTARIPARQKVDSASTRPFDADLPRNYESYRVGSVHKYNCGNSQCDHDLTLGLIHGRGKSFLVRASDVKPISESPSWRFVKGYELQITIENADNGYAYLQKTARVACYQKGARADGLISGYWPFNVRHYENEFWGSMARESLCNS